MRLQCTAVLFVCMYILSLCTAARKLKPSKATRHQRDFTNQGGKEGRTGEVHIDFSNAIFDEKTGKRCVMKQQSVQAVEKSPILECTHKESEQCHYTYVTKFSSAQEEVCDENFEKLCQLTFMQQAVNETVRKCYKPAVKSCTGEGDTVCKTIYESSCTTKYVEQQPGRFVGNTSCEKLPIEVCGAGCTIRDGEEECHDKTVTSLVDVPEEHCDLNPRKYCRLQTKLVPKLVPKHECTLVPREVCSFKQAKPRVVYKPFFTKWCLDEIPADFENRLGEDEKESERLVFLGPKTSSMREEVRSGLREDTPKAEVRESIIPSYMRGAYKTSFKEGQITGHLGLERPAAVETDRSAHSFGRRVKSSVLPPEETVKAVKPLDSLQDLTRKIKDIDESRPFSQGKPGEEGPRVGERTVKGIRSPLRELLLSLKDLGNFQDSQNAIKPLEVLLELPSRTKDGDKSTRRSQDLDIPGMIKDINEILKQQADGAAEPVRNIRTQGTMEQIVKMLNILENRNATVKLMNEAVANNLSNKKADLEDVELIPHLATSSGGKDTHQALLIEGEIIINNASSKDAENVKLKVHVDDLSVPSQPTVSNLINSQSVANTDFELERIQDPENIAIIASEIPQISQIVDTIKNLSASTVIKSKDEFDGIENTLLDISNLQNTSLEAGSQKNPLESPQKISINSIEINSTKITSDNVNKGNKTFFLSNEQSGPDASSQLDPRTPVTLSVGRPDASSQLDQGTPVTLSVGRPDASSQLDQRTPVLQSVGRPDTSSQLDPRSPVTLPVGRPDASSQLDQRTPVLQPVGRPDTSIQLDQGTPVLQSVGRPDTSSQLDQRTSVFQYVGRPDTSSQLDQGTPVLQSVGRPDTSSQLDQRTSVFQYVGRPDTSSQLDLKTPVFQPVGRPDTSSQLDEKTPAPANPYLSVEALLDEDSPTDEEILNLIDDIESPNLQKSSSSEISDLLKNRFIDILSVRDEGETVFSDFEPQQFQGFVDFSRFNI